MTQGRQEIGNSNKLNYIESDVDVLASAERNFEQRLLAQDNSNGNFGERVVSFGKGDNPYLRKPKGRSSVRRTSAKYQPQNAKKAQSNNMN